MTGDDSYTCKCADGYEGSNCETSKPVHIYYDSFTNFSRTRKKERKKCSDLLYFLFGRNSMSTWKEDR